MSRNLIFTTHINGNRMPSEMDVAYKMCQASQKVYAEKIGASFICQTEKVLNLSDHGNDEKLNIYWKLNEYDRALSLDSDILIKPDAPNIFDICDREDSIYMLNETKQNKDIVMKSYIPDIRRVWPGMNGIIGNLIKNYRYPNYYNVGVMLASKPCQEIFHINEDYPNPPSWRSDQDFVNMKIWKHMASEGLVNNITMDLPLIFNGMFLYNPYALGFCHFLHYAGGHYDEVLTHFADIFKDTIDMTSYDLDPRHFLPSRMRTNDSVRIGLKTMVSCLSKQQGNVGVEIGAYSGEGTEILAKVCERLYAVDPWKDKYGAVPMDRIEKEFDVRMKPFPNVIKVKTTSENAADEILEPLDFVYIDGCHDYENVKGDIKRWSLRVVDGGCVCGHDMDIPDVRNAVNEIFGQVDGVKLQTFADNSWMYHK